MLSSLTGTLAWADSWTWCCTCPAPALDDSNACCDAQLKMLVLCAGSRSTKIWRSSDLTLQVIFYRAPHRVFTRVTGVICGPVMYLRG